MSEKAFNNLENYFEYGIDFLKQLISYYSIFDNETAEINTPFGRNINECFNYFLNEAKEKGFETKNIDNMIGYAETGSGDLIGILAHLDVVPVNDLNKWTYPPFKAEIHDNKLYGRGSSDDKGPLMAAFIALLALKNSDIKLNKRFRIIAGLDEESDMRCLRRYVQTEEIPVFSFSPDANFPAVYAEKGQMNVILKRKFQLQGYEEIKLLGLTAGTRTNVVPDKATAYFSGNIAKLKRQIEELELDYIETDYYKDDYLMVTAYGKAAHAMHPHHGENAVYRLFKCLAHESLDFGPWELLIWLRNNSILFTDDSDGKNFNIDCKDDISGALTINLGLLHYKGEDLTLKFDIRYPVTMEPEKMEIKMKKLAEKLAMLFKVSKHLPPLYVEKENPYLQQLLKAYSGITKDNSEPLAIGGRTYCTLLPNAVSFGAVFPNDVECAHNTDEFIDLDKLKLTAKIYLQALINLNNM